MFRSICFLLFLFTFTATISAQRTAASETRDLANFNTVDVSHNIKTSIRQGSTYAVKITADDNLIDRVETRIRGERLIITLANGDDRNSNVHIDITMPVLRGINASGSSAIRVDGFNQTRSDVELNASGASVIAIQQSTAGHLDLTTSGASKIDCPDFLALTADISISGNSSVNFYVKNSISGSAADASSVWYKGNPEVRVATSGASRLRSY